MSQAMSLLLTAIGSYAAAPRTAETWQVGIRLAYVQGSIDPVGTLPTNVAPYASAINRTETNWTIVGNWKAGAGAPGFDPGDYLNDQAAPAFTTWMAAGPLSTAVVLKQLKLSPIGSPSGKLIPAPPYAQGTPCLLSWTANNPKGTFGGGAVPLQIACVVQHRTQQVGRQGRGRMFLPPVGLNGYDNSTGLWSTAQASANAAQKALLEALVLSPADPLGAHVAPIVTGKPFTNYAKINAVRTGNVPDTQRRRRRSLPETYVTATVNT